MDLQYYVPGNIQLFIKNIKTLPLILELTIIYFRRLKLIVEQINSFINKHCLNVMFLGLVKR